MKSLDIHSNIHDYKVFFHENLDFIGKLVEQSNRIFVMDRNIYNLYARYFERIDLNDIFLLDATEENKTLKSVEQIYAFLATKDSKRNTTLVSIGGGITQDITGFATSTVYRGIRWIFIPTTFLSQADSCIGSKTSLNFENYKNIIGGFYPPHEIYVAPEFLNTLSEKDYYSGIGEVIKFALLKEEPRKNYSELIEKIDNLKQRKNILNTIHETMEIKSAYIKIDEFDTGKRNLFNYGHCFGHALENSSHYEVPHGIAVTIGMIYANIVSLGRGLVSRHIFDLLNNDLLLPSVFMKLEATCFDFDILLNSMKNDKKRVGANLTIIIPSSDNIEAIKVDDLSEGEFGRCLDLLLDTLGLKS
jgi:3-dehydroquinate synthase